MRSWGSWALAIPTSWSMLSMRRYVITCPGSTAPFIPIWIWNGVVSLLYNHCIWELEQSKVESWPYLLTSVWTPSPLIMCRNVITWVHSSYYLNLKLNGIISFLYNLCIWELEQSKVESWPSLPLCGPQACLSWRGMWSPGSTAAALISIWNWMVLYPYYIIIAFESWVLTIPTHLRVDPESVHHVEECNRLGPQQKYDTQCITQLL